LAQHRGIANKGNFELQVNYGNVLLYVHDVNFDSDKIKTAVDIVENFKQRLDEINIEDGGYTIEKCVLDEINKEFNDYATKKHALLKSVKDNAEKMNALIAELKMPSLEKFLYTRFAFSSNQISDNMCKYCEKSVPKSMSQHYRYCSAKKEFDGATGTTMCTTDEVNVQQTTIPNC
jgi:hypothetical protein